MTEGKSTLKFSIDRILDKSGSVEKKQKCFDEMGYYETTNPFFYSAYYNNLSLVKYKFEKCFGKSLCGCGICSEKVAILPEPIECQCKPTLKRQISYDQYNTKEYLLQTKYDDVFMDEDMAVSPQSG